MKPLFRVVAPVTALVFALSGCSFSASVSVGGDAHKPPKVGEKADVEKLGNDLVEAMKKVKYLKTASKTEMSRDETVETQTVDYEFDYTDPTHPRGKAIIKDGKGGEIIQIGDGWDFYTKKKGEAKYKKESSKPQEKFDPSEHYRKLMDQVESAEYLGTEDVKGKKAYHYKLTSKQKNTSKEGGVQLGVYVPEEIWLYGDNKFAQFMTTNEYPQLKMKSKTVQTYYDYDKKVTVTPPDPSEVA